LIDYIKIRLKDYAENNLLESPLLNFGRNINEKTGEIINVNKKGQPVTPQQIAHYKGLTFIIYDTGSIYVSGSIHKYFYNGLHNFKDFGINEINHVLNDLQQNFNISSKQCTLVNIELGININPPIKTELILKGCLLHKTNPFEYKYNSDEGKYLQCEHAQYLVKIYDKRRRYKKYFQIDKDILRFELKFNRMEYLNKKGIHTLKDLLNYGLHNFKGRLINEWNNVIYYDKTSIKDEKKQLQYSNPNYWLELKRDNFKYHRKQLNKLINKNTKNIKGQIAELIAKKIDFLNMETTRIDTLYILSKRVVSTLRKCIITGYDISMQKEDSKLLSHTGLRYYKLHHYRMYKEIERVYLTNYWKSATDEVKIKEIAHNIRNKYYNNSINENQMKLAI